MLDSCLAPKGVQPQWKHVEPACEADLAAGSPSGSQGVMQSCGSPAATTDMSEFEVPSTQRLLVTDCASENSDTSVTESMRELRKSQFIEEQALEEMDKELTVARGVAAKFERDAGLTMGPGASLETEAEVTCSKRPNTSWTAPLVSLNPSNTQAKDALTASDLSLRENPDADALTASDLSLRENPDADSIDLLNLAVHWAGLPEQEPKPVVYVDTSQVSAVDINCSCNACA